LKPSYDALTWLNENPPGDQSEARDLHAAVTDVTKVGDFYCDRVNDQWLVGIPSGAKLFLVSGEKRDTFLRILDERFAEESGGSLKNEIEYRRNMQKSD
jgi:hypothetical protein